MGTVSRNEIEIAIAGQGPPAYSDVNSSIAPTFGVGLSDALNQAIRAIGGLVGCKVMAFSPISTRASG